MIRDRDVGDVVRMMMMRLLRLRLPRMIRDRDVGDVVRMMRLRMPRMIRDAGDVVRMMRLLRLRLTRVIRDRHVGDVPPPSLLLRSPVWVGDVEIPPQSLLLLLR